MLIEITCNKGETLRCGHMRTASIRGLRVHTSNCCAVMLTIRDEDNRAGLAAQHLGFRLFGRGTQAVENCRSSDRDAIAT